MKILKYAICWICLTVLCIYAFSLHNPVAAESYYMGYTKWNLENGCLTISGSGPIADRTCPWGLDKESVTEIIIEPGVTGIGKEVFKAWRSLTKVTIGEGLKYIDQSAFDGCINLQAISLPASVKSIEYNAFKDCAKLKSVSVADLVSWCSVNFNNLLSNPLSNGADLYIDGQLVTDLVIPEGCEEITPYAFAGCRSIQTVHFSKGVQVIHKYAFFGCTNLKNIRLPGSLQMMGYSSFGQCPQLRKAEYNGSIRQLKALHADSIFGNSTQVLIWQMRTGYTLLFATITQVIGVGIPVGIVFLILYIRKKRRGY